MVPNILSYLTQFDDYSVFNSVLNESGAFPSCIEFSLRFGGIQNRAQSEQAMVQSLKADKFLRLVESKAVEFNFFLNFLMGIGESLL